MSKKSNLAAVLLWAVFYLAIFSILLNNSFSYLDSDLGWHLGLGQRIAETGEAPKENLINYPIAGEEWIDHEWLINYLTYQVYDKLGFIGLNIFFALLPLGVLFLLHWWINRHYLKKASTIALAGLIFLGLYGMLPSLGIRMQEMALLGLTLLLILIYFYDKKQKSPIFLLWLAPLFFVWTNLHGSFIIGLFLMAFFVAVKIGHTACYLFFPNLAAKFGPKPSLKRVLLFLPPAIAGAGATLLTPYGTAIIDLFSRIHIGGAYHLKNIAEWLPTYAIPLQYPQIAYMAVAAAAVLIALGSVFAARQKESERPFSLDAWQLSLFALFLFLAFQSKRHFPLFFVASLPLAVEIYARELSQAPAFLNWLKQSRLIRFYLLAGLLGVISLQLLKTNFTTTPFQDRSYCQTYPCQALEFIKNNPELRELRLFNNYDWGGYIFWVWPGKQTFIDGRLPQHPVDGHTFLEEYHEFYAEEEEKVNPQLAKYGVEVVLYKKYPPYRADWLEQFLFRLPDPVIERGEDGLRNYLEEKPAWELIYEDNLSKVYKKVNS